MSQLPSKPIVAFDFDGVIVNSFDVVFAASQQYEGQKTHEDFRALFHGNVFDSALLKEIISKNPNHSAEFAGVIGPQIRRYG